MTSSALAHASTAGAEPAPDRGGSSRRASRCWSSTCRRAAGARVDDGRPQGCPSAVRRRPSSPVSSCRGRSSLPWSAPRVARARPRTLRRRRAAGIRTPAPTAGPRRHPRRRPRAARPPELARVLRPEADWPLLRRRPVRHAHGPARLRAPGGEDDRAGRAQGAGRRPSAQVGSLVVNPGGPGAPGIDYAAAGAQRRSASRCSTHFDIVGFDPRGIGAARPVDCLSDAAARRVPRRRPRPRHPGRGRGVRAGSAGVRRGLRRLQRRPGLATSRPSRPPATWTSCGPRSASGSWTTSVRPTAPSSARRTPTSSPTRVGRMVLDGAIDPSLSHAQLDLGAGRRLRDGAATPTSTTASTAAAASSATPSPTALHADPATSSTRSTQKPLPTGGGRELDRSGLAFYGIVAAALHRDYWSLLTSALQRGARAATARCCCALADLYTRARRRLHRQLDRGALRHQLPRRPRLHPDRPGAGHFPAFEKASPTFGTVFAWGLTACATWPAHERPSRCRPSTPRARRRSWWSARPATRRRRTRWASRLADQLASGVLVSRDGDGHTGYHRGNDCVDDAVEDYLVAGVVPQDGLSC